MLLHKSHRNDKYHNLSCTRTYCIINPIARLFILPLGHNQLNTAINRNILNKFGFKLN